MIPVMAFTGYQKAKIDFCKSFDYERMHGIQLILYEKYLAYW